MLVHRSPSRSRGRGPSGQRILFSILLAALVLFVVPRSWLSRLAAVVRLIPSSAPSGGSLPVGDLIPTPTSLTVEEYQRLVTEKETLLNQGAALSARVRDLEEENRLLLRARSASLGVSGHLLEAEVISEDPAFWRRSGHLNQGRWAGIQVGHLVLSRFFSAKVSSGHPQNATAALLGEVLLGVVDEVQGPSARVIWISDPDFEMEVLLARQTSAGIMLGQKPYWMRGAGEGLLHIVDVDQRDVDQGLVAEGDLVLARPSGSALPTAMRIGTVRSIQPDPQHPLLRTLEVAASLPADRLEKVYLYIPDAPTGEGTPGSP